MLNGFGDVEGALALVREARTDASQKVLHHGADMSKCADIEQMMRFTEDTLGPVAVLVNNAGIQHVAPVEEFSPEKWDQILAINLSSTFHTTRLAIPSMRARNWGRIVNVAAKPALVPTAGLGAYAMSKAAVAALSTSLAEELKDEEIWVNAVVPSTMDTAANRAAMPGADFSKWPTVEDVAETLVFLASPANRVTRGALVPVYGRS
jgi:3-hydroxybutyrate dehydrogenase